MMLRKKSSRWTGVKALFVLPFAAASLGAFAQTVYVVSSGKVSKDSVTASVSGPDISLGKLDGQPLYLVDGQEVASLDGIPTDKIASIDVLKDGQAVETYGDKARNGVVAVTLKNEGDSRKSEAAAAGNVVVLRYSSDSVPSGPAPLYIVDGEETDGERLNRIDPDRIASIDIYKDAATLAAYGDKARNGVAVITLKKEGSVKADKHSVQIDDASIVVRGSSDSVSLDKVNAYFKSDEWKEAQHKIAGSQKYFESDEWKAAQEQLSQAATAGSVVSIRGTAAGNLLYLVDGVKADDLGWIAAEQIGSMSVFKGSASVPEQYRGQGYDGVVVITTKKAATADKDWGISTSDRNSVWTHHDSVTQAKGSITIT
ncbi:MAG: TonB-dependent receptor plug domain-containing protein, partial [Alistipes sp.]|nr:TonB-dependent receptor plug domain-containing protein [Alistipes sp.]